MMLVLEDPGGETLDRFLPGPLDMTRFLHLAVGIAAALIGVQKEELIHKDIKPANVLVDSATGQVRLMGFGIASRVPRERQSPEAPEFIAGSLPYIAPEQTGRMNRSIDSRSDLYSLGVTLYEMSTGRLPFNASDPMEWVHCQIARQPVSPRERAPNIPGPVSAIIMLAKTAEERYQTAVGLERDFQRCLKEWENRGRIDEFPLGEHDKPDRLLIPEKLYGRESEINTLLASFGRVVDGGRPDLVLVSGYSGVGKSSVVNELHKPLRLAAFLHPASSTNTRVGDRNCRRPSRTRAHQLGAPPVYGYARVLRCFAGDLLGHSRTVHKSKSTTFSGDSFQPTFPRNVCRFLHTNVFRLLSTSALP